MTSTLFKTFLLQSKHTNLFTIPYFLKLPSICLNFSLPGHFVIICRYFLIPLVRKSQWFNTDVDTLPSNGWDAVTSSVPCTMQYGKCILWSMHTSRQHRLILRQSYTFKALLGHTWTAGLEFGTCSK